MVFVLAVLTIAACLLVDYWMTRRAEQAAAAEAPAAAGLAASPVPVRQPLRFPAGGFYLHGGHTWAQLLPSGEARVGLDDFAQGVIGRIDAIELPPPGLKVRQGETAFTVVQKNKRIDFVAPLSGVVSGVNAALAPAAEAVKADPYREGWILALRPADAVREIRRLRIARAAAEWLERELKRLAEFIALYAAVPGEVGVTMADGGFPAAGVVERIDGELFEVLVRKFFR